jgi:hypothetical protein
MQGLSSPHQLWVQVEAPRQLIASVAKIARFFLSGLRKSLEKKKRDLGNLEESMATNLGKPNS